MTPDSTLYCAVRQAPPTRLLVSCGEPSGDLYGAELVRHLGEIVRPLETFGLGGDRLAAAGLRPVAHVRDLAVVGLVEVLRHLRRLRTIFRSLIAEVDRSRPDVAVLVDYPDFNLRLARALKARGVPVVYYVSPQIWAWRGGRIRAIRETVAHMLVIFPFEEPIYRKAGIPVTFVGHPLAELVQPAADEAAFLRRHGLAPERPVLAVLPGSRPQEVRHHLDPLGAALRIVAARRPDVQMALGIAPSLNAALFDGPALAGLQLSRITGESHGLMGTAAAGVVASGTATVEAALLGMPMVVVYRLSGLTYALGRPFVRVPHYAMVNLIAGRAVVKELIQSDFRPGSLSREVLRLLEQEPRRAEMIRGLQEVRARLGGPGASSRAASVVARFVSDARKA